MQTNELLDRISALIEERDSAEVIALAGRTNTSQWADVIPQLDENEVATLFRLIPDGELPDVLAELDPAHAAEILRTLNRFDAADLLGAMDPDDATDLIDELSDDHAEALLTLMTPADAEEIRELLAYPAESAGGIMTPSFVAIAPDLRAAQAISALQQVSDEVETMYYVYVLDEEEHLLGVLSLHRLVLTRPETPVRDLMASNPIAVHVATDQETAARRLTDHNLLALPVVDDENRLLGIITQDDVADVLEEEATEDIERLGGSQPLDVPYRMAGVSLLFRRRVIWLLLLFAAEAYTGTVLRHFEDEIAKVVALSFFIPLLIGTGGNIGSQVTTTLVRAMAVGEVRLRDVRWVLAKEVCVGLVLGGVMAGFAFGRAELLHVGIDVGLVIAITIAAICIWSATVAAVLPLLLQKAKIDPAVVSAPLITTLVDGTGLVIYFTIAKYMLNL